MIRQRTSLDGVWEFYPDTAQRLEPGTLKESGAARQVRVPGPWQAQFEDLRLSGGVAWYRREFEIPKAQRATTNDDAQTYVLHFGAVDYFASVWLNGQLLGEHEGGYLPFELTLDAALRFDGANELIVRVLDPDDADVDVDGDEGARPPFSFAEIPHGKQSWYGPLSGIWQSVYWETRHAVHVERLHVTPDVPKAAAHVDVRLNAPAPQALKLRLTLTDPRGQTTPHNFVLDVGERSFQTVLGVPDPVLWDTNSPELYRLEAALLETGAASAESSAKTAAEVSAKASASVAADGSGAPLDAFDVRFGMRSIAASSDGHLMLNGRVMYLRGALDQDYYADLIYTPFSDAELDEQFAKAKHMGLNCLRTHIKITDPRYYDAADRAGLLIWTELPNWENLTPKVKERARETLTGMVERDWNHPSIIIWTIVNEGWGVELAVNPDHRAWLAESYDYLKGLDPHRLVVGNSACFSNFHVVTDIEDFHNYYSIPDHYRQWREWVETFAARPPWTFAHTYQSIDAWREYLRDPWKPLPRTATPEVRRTGQEPIVVSEFGNWGLPDVEKLRQCFGGRDPDWFESGSEWADGSVYPHGIEERFRLWHLDKIFPTLADLATASQNMQFCALKYQIEQMRRLPSIVGYVITEFTDVQWECNGLLDMCRNPKSFYDEIAAVNSADAIVPDWQRVAFWQGERCEVQLTLSHFSNQDLGDCRLEWSLEGFPQIHGAFERLMPRPAQNIDVGTVSFEVPRLAESTRARLHMRLLDAAGASVTSNYQDLYLFPRTQTETPGALLFAPSTLADKLQSMGFRLTKDLGEAELVITDVMTDELRVYVQNGGRALWLAESNNSQQAYLHNVEITERAGRRWQGDWASNLNWIRQDRMFQRIPTDGMVDFAFADLTPEHVITGIPPRDFASNVYAGLFVGWLHHVVALVAERRYGDGRLLISTFRLLKHLDTHPVANIMLQDMVLHLSTRKRHDDTTDTDDLAQPHPPAPDNFQATR